MCVLLAKLPSYLDVNCQWHHQDGDHNIGNRERDDEVIGDRLESPFSVDAQANQHITEDSDYWEKKQHQIPVLIGKL